MRIFISCSSSDLINSKYKTLAMDVSEIFANRNDKLVYCGLDTGMINKCYQVFKYHDLKVKSVYDIKDIDRIKDLEHDKETSTITTFERLKECYLTAEMIVILPGGIQTISELFGILEEKKHKKDSKEIIILNYNNYYDHLLNMLNECYKEGFEIDMRNGLYQVVNSVEELQSLLERG